MEEKSAPIFGKQESPPNVYRSNSSDLVRFSSPEARALIDRTHAISNQALPLGIINLNGRELVTIAVAAPIKPEAARILQFITGREVRLVEVDKVVLLDALAKAYLGDDRILAERVKRLSDQNSNVNSSRRSDSKQNSDDVPQFINTLISYAYSHSASDIHIVPRVDGTYIHLRINGELVNHTTPICSLEIHHKIISCIKVLANIDITKRNIASDGSFKFLLLDKEIHLRISTIPTIHGEKAVLRLHGCGELWPLEKLGLDLVSVDLIKRTANTSNGLIVFCGPTGSGKSTTMYSLLEYVSKSNRSIVTIEDPVELALDFASQTDISKNSDLNFSRSLRFLLRQDPDCIMLGEIRDTESAQAAIEASVTGHLVVTSLHAGDTLEALTRLLYLGINPHQLAEACRMIVSQKLLPKLCNRCKVIDLNQSNQFERAVYRGVGCESCDYTGFTGRVLCSEMLYLDQELREVISSRNRKRENLIKHTNQSNYVPYKKNLYRLVLEGQIEASLFAEKFDSI